MRAGVLRRGKWDYNISINESLSGMNNPQIMLQSCNFYYQLACPQLSYPPTFSLIHSLISTQESLKQQVIQLQAKLTVLEREKESKDSEENSQITAKVTKSERDPLPTQKIFKKDRHCPVRTCDRKYSSKIALNAHLRRTHPRYKAETSDYEP